MCMLKNMWREEEIGNQRESKRREVREQRATVIDMHIISVQNCQRKKFSRHYF